TLMNRYFPEMVEVKGGTFNLGSLDKNLSPDSAIRVTLSDFKMAKTETTVWQYQLFAKATGRDTLFEESKPSAWGKDWMGNTPMVNVSWYDAIAYANWLSERMGIEKVYQLDSIPKDPNDMYGDTSFHWTSIPNWEVAGYRLPTEAEWEYAAKGGENQDPFEYSGSNSIGQVAWYSGNVDLKPPFGRTHPVAQKDSNSLGLYDMSGNVWEWCWDGSNYIFLYTEESDFHPGSYTDPRTNEGRYRVLRGGSWLSDGGGGGVLVRLNYDPNGRNYGSGFRLSQGL
ncbi:MAG: formylglycine-generating enzyme family protein, partial [Bacteroidota bacterium]